MILSKGADNKQSLHHLTFDFGCCVDVSIILSTCWQTSHISSYNAFSIRLAIKPKTLSTEGEPQLKVTILSFSSKTKFTQNEIIIYSHSYIKVSGIQCCLEHTILLNIFFFVPQKKEMRTTTWGWVIIGVNFWVNYPFMSCVLKGTVKFKSR